MPWGEKKKLKKLVDASTPAVVAYMDRLEAENWEWVQTADREGEAAATSRLGSVEVAPVVQDLLVLCDNRIEVVMDCLGRWQEEIDDRWGDVDDEDGRGLSAAGLYMAVGLTGIGNLFGYIPEAAPSFDPELAAQGLQRGWRK